jgi:hypothetical protein
MTRSGGAVSQFFCHEEVFIFSVVGVVWQTWGLQAWYGPCVAKIDLVRSIGSPLCSLPTPTANTCCQQNYQQTTNIIINKPLLAKSSPHRPAIGLASQYHLGICPHLVAMVSFSVFGYNYCFHKLSPLLMSVRDKDIRLSTPPSDLTDV